MQKTADSKRIPPAPEAQRVLHFVTEDQRQTSVAAYRAQLRRDAARVARAATKAQQPPKPVVIEVCIRNRSLFEALVDDDAVALLNASVAPTDPTPSQPKPEQQHRQEADIAALEAALAKPEGDEYSPEKLKEKREHIEAIADHPELFVAWFLERNLRVLSGVGSRRAKLETLDWILAPDIDGEVLLRDGSRRVPVFTDKVPLSFTWCCKLFGLSRERYVDGLREEIASAMQHVHKPHQKETFSLMLAKLGESQ